MPPSKMQEVVSNESMEKLLNYLLEDSALEETEAEKLREEAQSIQNYLLEESGVFEETDTLESYIALRFAELKAKWIIINARIQDYNRRLEMPELYLTYRSSLISGILGILEEYLPTVRVRPINETLADQASNLESESYVMIEGDQIVIEGKRKIVIYRKGRGAD